MTTGSVNIVTEPFVLNTTPWYSKVIILNLVNSMKGLFMFDLWPVHTKYKFATDQLATDWLQTGKIQLGYSGMAWFHSHQF